MTICYIAHPISSDVQGNLTKIAEIVRDINLTEPDVVPFVPYYADCVAMDDSVLQHRTRGIRNNYAYFIKGMIDEVWVYGDGLSAGVQGEIALAQSLGIPVKFKTV